MPPSYHGPIPHVNSALSEHPLARAVNEQHEFLYAGTNGYTFVAGSERKKPDDYFVWFRRIDSDRDKHLAADDAIVNFENDLPGWMPLNPYKSAFYFLKGKSRRKKNPRNKYNVKFLGAFGVDFDPDDEKTILNFRALRRFIERRCKKRGLPLPNGYMRGRGVWALWLIDFEEATHEAKQLYIKIHRMLRVLFRKGCRRYGCHVCKNGGKDPTALIKIAESRSDKDGVVVYHRLEEVSRHRHDYSTFCETVVGALRAAYPNSKLLRERKPVPKRKPITEQERAEALAILEGRVARVRGKSRSWDKLADDYVESFNELRLLNLLYDHRKPNPRSVHNARIVRFSEKNKHKVKEGRRRHLKAVANSLHYGEHLNGEHLHLAVAGYAERVIENIDGVEVREIVAKSIEAFNLHRATAGKDGEGPDIENFYDAMNFGEKFSKRILRDFPFGDKRQRRSEKNFRDWAVIKHPDLIDDLAETPSKDRLSVSWVKFLVLKYPETMTAKDVQEALMREYLIRRAVKTIQVDRQEARRKAAACA